MHDDGAAAPEKFNGLLRDAAAGIVIRLCGTGWRETNLNSFRKHDYFPSDVCLSNSASEHFIPSESFGHVCGSIGGAFRPSSWKKCGAGAAVSMTLSGWHCAQARWRARAAAVVTRGGLVTAPDCLTDYGLHYEFKFKTSALRIPAPSVVSDIII